MEQPSFQKDELDRLKSSYHPNPEFTKTLKQQDKLNKDTVLKLLEQGFDPNDNGAYCEFPYFLQSEDQETFEVLRDFGANTDLSKLDPTLINDAHLINYQFYDLYESFILALRPGTFAMVTELSKLQWLKSKGFDFNIPPFMKLQTFSLKTPWTVLVSPTSYNLPDVTSFLVNETNLDFNLELVLEDTKIKGRFLNWHFYAFNILANEYRPVNDRKKDLESFIALLGNKIDIHSKTSEGRNIYFILPFIKSAQAKEAAKILMDMGITPYEKDHSERSFVDCFKGDKNMNAAIQLIETNKDKISVVPKKADNQAIETEQKKVESAVDQPDTNTKGKPVIEPVMLDEKETGHQSETPDQAFLPFQNKLKAFVSLLESYQKDNISEVEALSFIKEAAKEGLNSDDIDAIMVKLNQGSRRFGLMRVKKFLNAAERYLETMNKENEYEDVVLDNHGKKTKCSLSLELLPVILNDHGDRFDQRINLENLFDLDSTIVKSIIEESGKHKKIVKFVYYASRSYRLTKDNEEQSIYDVGILFDDGMYRTWHDQKSHMADQVKTVMDIDYYVGNDGFLYQYSDTSNEFLVVPGIDNIEEVWYERYFTLDHLKFVYRHKITKKLISIGYPEDDYLTGVINPVKVCLYQKIRSVLDKDGILRYRDKNNQEVELSQVFDANYEDYFDFCISLKNGEVLIGSQTLKNPNPVKIHKGYYHTILTDSKTNKIVYGLNNNLTEGVKEIEFKDDHLHTVKIELESGRVIVLQGITVAYDSLFNSSAAENLDFFSQTIYGYSLRNDVTYIGGSDSLRGFLLHNASKIAQQPRFINTVFDYDDHFSCLTDHNQVFMYCDGKMKNAVSKVYADFTVENVIALACTNDFIAFIKLDGTLECFSQSTTYGGISKTKKYRNVTELMAFNKELYFLTADGECWKFSKQANSWILFSTGIRSLRVNEKGLIANRLNNEKTDEVIHATVEKPQIVDKEFENIEIKSFDLLQYSGTAKGSYFTRDYSRDAVKQAQLAKEQREVLTNNIWVHAGSSHMVWINPSGNAFASGENLYGSCSVEKWSNMTKIYAVKNGSIGLTDDHKILVACTNRKINPWADVPIKEGVKDLAAVDDKVIIVYQSGTTIGFNCDKPAWKTLSKKGIRVDVHFNKIYLIDETLESEDQSNRDSIEATIVIKETKKNTAGQDVDQTEQKRLAYLTNPSRHRVSVSKNHFVLIMDNGKVLAAGDNRYGQCEVDTWEDIVAVAAGNKFTAGLTKTGEVIYSGVKHFYSLAWNIQGTATYRNNLESDKAQDLVAVDDYFFSNNYEYFLGGTENCYKVDREGTLRNSHIYDNIVKKFKNIVGVISLPEYGGDCYLDANGTLFDQKNKIVDKGILSVAKEKFMVKSNGLQTSDGTIIYPDEPIAYAYGRYGLVYIDKEGSTHIYFPESNEHIPLQVNVSETDTYGCMTRNNYEIYKPYIAYADETTFPGARMKYQWQTSHQLAYFKKGYVGINEHLQLVTDVDELKAFIQTHEKPVKAVCSSSSMIMVLFMDGTVASNSKEDFSKLTEIISLGISDTNIICVDKYHNVIVFGNNDYAQFKAMEWKNIVDVAAGPGFVLGLTESGERFGEGNLPDGGFGTRLAGRDHLSVYSFKNACITLSKTGYLDIFGNILKANDRLNLQTIANLISVSAYENTIVLVNSSGEIVSNQLDNYVPVKLPDLPTSVLLLKNKIVAKLVDGTVKEYEYDSIG